MLTFDEEQHEYRVKGHKVPSVTRIVKALNPDKFAGIPQHIMDNASDRGNIIHDWIDVYLRTGKEPLLEDFEPGYERFMECLAYFNAFVEFKSKHSVGMLKSEERMHLHDIMAGTLDFYGTVNRNRYIMDWKTTASSDGYADWGIQMALYHRMLQCNDESLIKPKTYRYVLRITKEGKYELINLSDGMYLLVADEIIEHFYEGGTLEDIAENDRVMYYYNKIQEVTICNNNKLRGW